MCTDADGCKHPLVDSERLRRFMQALGSEPECAGRVYVTGGGSAVLVGWRAQTADADLLVVPLGLGPEENEPRVR